MLMRELVPAGVDDDPVLAGAGVMCGVGARGG